MNGESNALIVKTIRLEMLSSEVGGRDVEFFPEEGRIFLMRLTVNCELSDAIEENTAEHRLNPEQKCCHA